jgi:hypothetical protein
LGWAFRFLCVFITVLSVLRVRLCNFVIVTNSIKIRKKAKIIIKKVGRTVNIGCDFTDLLCMPSTIQRLSIG